MEILMIGNGFDLEHDLPTSYGSFLEFCEKAIFCGIYGSYSFNVSETLRNNWKVDKQIIERVISAFRKKYKDCLEEDKNKEKLIELYEYIHDNVWLEYFQTCMEDKKNIGENWIDFEMEISHVIQVLDVFRDALFNANERQGYDIYKKSIYQSSILKRICTIKRGDDIKSIDELDRFVSVLDAELERFIRALEIYIDEIVNKLPITKKSKDIEKINPDFVLSFNYSNTYERIYGIEKEKEKEKGIQYDYIHGKADANKNIKTCNLVLGIDEYLGDDRKDTDLEFIVFKKYFQRIYKSTGNAYLKWVEKIKKDYDEYIRKIRLENIGGNETTVTRYMRATPMPTQRIQCPTHTLYIFGHSLDVTDRDILRLFICNDNVQTKIFYHQKDEDDKTTLGKLIKNLVRIMGQDELIRRTGGEHKTIEFIPQSKHEE